MTTSGRRFREQLGDASIERASSVEDGTGALQMLDVKRTDTE